jgi:hypothetical protein
MNNVLKNNEYIYKSYNKYKSIITAFRTKIDAVNFLNKLKITDDLKKILQSLINSKSYNKTNLDYFTIKQTLAELKVCKYKEDIEECISKLHTDDKVLIKCIKRIIDSKQNKPIYISLQKIRDKNMVLISKTCPHCGNKCNFTPGTKYVICGYNYEDIGYDWNGCGKDWCFICGKMLCKSWENDQLFLEFNRLHDNKCCKKHAHESDYLYPENYCQCESDNVSRICE